MLLPNTDYTVGTVMSHAAYGPPINPTLLTKSKSLAVNFEKC